MRPEVLPPAPPATAAQGEPHGEANRAMMRAERFDFVEKLLRFPERIEAALRRDPAAISTVYLDVNTDICNHRCTFCDGFFRKLHAGEIAWPRLERLVGEMEDAGVLAVVLAGDRGEPLLHSAIARLLERLARSPIRFGIYTNGTVVPDAALEPLGAAAFVRVSADAGSAETHRTMHVYPWGRNDFERVVANVSRLAERIADVGVSFTLDRDNAHELELAADVFLGAGAHFIEIKPRFLREYAVDAPWLGAARDELRAQIARARARWGARVAINDQLRALLAPVASAPTLMTAPRRCLTSMLRLVISTHGCYTCTPFRGEAERRVGDIHTQSLQEVLASIPRRHLVDVPCTRLCAYHEQNELLLDLEQRGGAPAAPAPGAPRSVQDHFL